MSIDAALTIATGGLANVSRQIALVSQNVANVSTSGYSVETPTQQSVTADGVGLGVRSGPAVRATDAALQAEVFGQNATVAGLQTQQTALQAIDSVQGTPGQGGDLASLLGKLQDQFSTLLNGPDNQAQQSQVVSSAATLARQINSLSGAYTAQRQNAQDSIVTDVGTMNTTLGTIGSLSNQIITLKAEGRSTADLENLRNAAVQTLSQLVSIKVLDQPNGDMLLTTTAGVTLPIHGVTNPLSTTGANMQPGSGAPPIMLGGVNVTTQLQGGQIGANITLRDTTLPTYQAELDEFSQNLASRFQAQGITLFSDPTGNVPANAAPPLPVQTDYVGFAAIIQVNPAVQSDPSLVRDGTVLPPTGLAGYTAVIQNVLAYALGAEQSPGVPQPPSNTSGLGPNGTLTAPYSAPATLSGIAATLVAAQAQDSATATNQLDTEQATQSTLNAKLQSETGVNMDTEMSNMIELQNAYGANAKIITAVQSMWAQLLATVQ